LKRSLLVLSLLAVAGVATGLTFGVNAPLDEFQGIFQKIMYVHVPSAWLAYLSFAVVLVAGIGYLVTKRHSWDRVAASSAEMGVFFTGVALITGMLWGRPVWGTFWDWGDARLVLTALMFIVYLGYLALRRSISNPDISESSRSSRFRSSTCPSHGSVPCTRLRRSCDLRRSKAWERQRSTLPCFARS